jgi:hypothetical protein
MLPYEQIKAQAEQRFARYEAEARDHRLLDRQRVHFGINVFRFRFRTARVRQSVLGEFSGPVQPAI